jgi:hypothetical protein
VRVQLRVGVGQVGQVGDARAVLLLQLPFRRHMLCTRQAPVGPPQAASPPRTPSWPPR